MIKESEKIKSIMEALGCIETKIEGVYCHPEFSFNLDLSATASDKVLARLWEIFSKNGYERCQENIRRAIGVENRLHNM